MKGVVRKLLWKAHWYFVWSTSVTPFSSNAVSFRSITRLSSSARTLDSWSDDRIAKPTHWPLPCGASRIHVTMKKSSACCCSCAVSWYSQGSVTLEPATALITSLDCCSCVHWKLSVMAIVTRWFQSISTTHRDIPVALKDTDWNFTSESSLWLLQHRRVHQLYTYPRQRTVDRAQEPWQ